MPERWTFDHAPDRDGRCLNCGSAVSEQFGRVFGDQDDRLHACPDCASMSQLMRGAGAGQTVDYHARSRGAIATDGGDRA